MNRKKATSYDGTSSKYFSPIAVWALSFGCAVGWGAFMMPGTTFLPAAGPLGTVLGLTFGTVIMLVVGVNYSRLMQRYPDDGGSYSYSKNILGGDHGFLCGWMLLLTYVSIIWANATALSLLLHHLVGDMFRFGFSYQIAGYTVWMGEVLLSVALITLTSLICIFSNILMKWIQTICAVLLFAGIVICFIAVVIHNGGFSSIKPLFCRDRGVVPQIFGIIILVPWAFIGFESICHTAGEFRFSAKKSLPIIIAALITSLLAYSMLTVCASMACPDGFADWEEYIKALASCDGINGVPTFYNAREAMGDAGLTILGISAFCGIITALIGYTVALSRLISTMADDRMLPKPLSKRNRKGIPWTVIICIGGISCLMPLVGRTAIGWIVDVTTIGTIVVYCYISVSSIVLGKRENRRSSVIWGVLGMAIGGGFAVWYVLPNFWTSNGLAVESYLILIVWALLGMSIFRALIQRDNTRRFGKSEIVWIILFLLILTVSVSWIQRTTMEEASAATQEVHHIHEEEAEKEGIPFDDDIVSKADRAVTDRIDVFSHHTIRNVLIQSGLTLGALCIIFSIFNLIKKREKDIEEEKLLAEENSRAKTTFLNNMSHDIRTPMNAVTGYTKLALEEKDLPDKVRDYLEKIDFSGKHLMSLINDILDMSRIESGKVELEIAPADLHQILDEVLHIFYVQMESKGITYTVDYSHVQNRYVFCDKYRLNRVILNLVSNAFKFTPEGGSVSIVLRQTGLEFGKASYVLSVKDTGIGMSEEFKERIFNSFERERTSTVSKLQGTGLGMSIAKSLVELMGGTIEVESEKGKGTKFTLNLTFPIARREDAELEAKIAEEAEQKDVSSVKLLVVEDNLINSEIACEILRRQGFMTETAENDKVAVEMIAAADPDTYSVILMDVQMPVMDGYTATKEIRAMEGKRSEIPIIALSANTFKSDRQDAFSAGMNDHVGKPFEPEVLIATIMKYIR